MRVGVEEAELENLLEEDACTGHGDILGRRAHQADALEVVDRHTFDELHGQHARSGQFGKREGNVHEAIARELEPAALDRAAFPREIELALDRPFKFAGHGERPVDGQIRDPPFDELGKVLDDVEIGLHDLGDIRPLDFQRDHAAVGEDGPVYL